MEDIAKRVRELLAQAVARNPCQGILLSGGLDTSILAFLAAQGAKPVAITVAFTEGEALDVSYATQVARWLNLEHHLFPFDRGELYQAIAGVIGILKTFDPMEVRNSAAIYLALNRAKEMGLNTVMTGDAADELFAGYSFFFPMEKEKLEAELKKMWQVMRFSSRPLAQALGLQARLPYLDPPFQSLAMDIGVELKVRRERERVWGKWILRKAFEGLLPAELVWRIKTPVEMGSGTTALSRIIPASLGEGEYQERKARYLAQEGVSLRDKEQLFYYELFRTIVGIPPSREGGCPHCHFPVEAGRSYCPTCGAYPIDTGKENL